MGLESSAKPEFSHWNSYSRFANRVKFSSRYVWSDEDHSFLKTVLATIRDRDGVLEEGQTLFRAQHGTDLQERRDDDGNVIGEEVWGLGSERMKPLADRAREGRANPTGIPVLYAANSVETAISEVRPWVGAEISVAVCKVLRPLKTLDLSLGHGLSSSSGPVFGHILNGKPLTAEQKEKAVWIDIDNAFSRPVTHSDDRADYSPTQILAELFRDAGYDAIGYKSLFGDKGDKLGFNIAIFDVSAVEIVSCAPYVVKSISVEAEQTDNAWSKRKS